MAPLFDPIFDAPAIAAPDTSTCLGIPLPGTSIDGRYVVRETLAVGGMACLVEATHRLLGRQVAIKFCRADRPQTAGRLLHEARILQALGTSHVVRVHDLGIHREMPYMVMELLDGRDLGATLELSGPLPVTLAVDCVLEAAVGLGEAHALGVIHRDVKPTNLFVAQTRDGEQAKVIDFGIAVARQATAQRPSPLSGVRLREDDGGGASRGTRLVGTPAFMSPEQIRRPSSVDERSDVWSLAVTLYQLVTGALPFTGADHAELTIAVLTEEPRPVGREIGAPWLDAVIERALAKHRDERTASMVDFAADLRPYASERGRLAYQRLDRASSARRASTAQLGRQMLDADCRAAGDASGDLERVHQLAEISRPVVAEQGERGFGGHRAVDVESREDLGGERAEIAATAGERRQRAPIA